MDEPISTLSVTPLYRQLKQALVQELERGRWRPDEKIPSEKELSVLYGVSRITVRAALDELCEEGRLLRIQGKGTFVTRVKTKKFMMIDNLSFADFCRRNGFTPGRRVLQQCMSEADEDDIVQLGLQKGELVVKIVRVLSADGVPFVLSEDRFAPGYAFLEHAEVENASLYETIVSHCGPQSFSSIRRTFECALADGAQAAALSVPKGSPMLLVRDIVADREGRLVRRSKELLAGDKIRLATVWKE
ncbi:GntR family transcriptional regulator [Harryflintia acetispora]|uniref:GntR family transcriptional regulator n=1 Tax=Harryflintia acetispora TaxID=1849041 RepID=UPI00189B158E|nr:GntR family transcriptional regulator [Harryflintia acetispora]